MAFRAMPALLGAMTVSTVFLIMWESGYSLPAAIVAAGLVLFDNAHIGQTRLILLDATLVFAMSVSVLCYVRFYKLRHDPFSRKWWKWLLLTGVAMSCVISTKYVGVFTFFTIGSAVAIDLWDLLNVNRPKGALSLPEFGKHFAARVVGLIIVPFLFYLFWFQVHFALLTKSGPGDDFMSPEFQETLSDNVMTSLSVGIDYYDSIAIRHKETKTYLHSHLDRYPLRYEDGRVSSQGQQVTGYPFNDTNNQWQILPAIPFPEDNPLGHHVKNGDLIKLRHLVTDSYLLTHDVASPLFPTNQEFTTVKLAEAEGERHNDTLFELRIENAKADQEFKSMSGQFKLIHFPTKVAMWTHTTPLPDWAHKQAEINGNKNLQQSSNVWYVDEIPSLPADSERLVKEPRKIKRLPFLKKYFELQRAIFFHNNALTSSHPYASQPIQWPFLLRGVSFWTQNDTRQQIYFLGNPIGWWLASSLLAVFVGIIGADQLSLRRGVNSLDEREFIFHNCHLPSSFVNFREQYHPYLLKLSCINSNHEMTIILTPVWGPGTRSRLYNSTGFFFLCWAAHYLPFYLMGRQLFLHHYLPAHLASALVTGALLEFIFNVEPLDITAGPQAQPNGSKSTASATPKKGKGSSTQSEKRSLTARERLGGQSLLALWAASGVIMAVVIGGWWFFLPLTYGKPGLTTEQVIARKWLGYDLHFAK